MKIVVKPRQTLADIAVQVYGDISAVPMLAKTNAVGITDPLTPGMALECPEQVYDQYIQDYVRDNRISPASAVNIDDEITLEK